MRQQPRDTRLALLLGLVLGLVTLGLYLPSLRCEFLAYDDQQYVTENLRVRAGLSLPGVMWAFGFHASNWHPLTWLSHMLDCQLYGLNAAGHHLTNVLLHTANAVLLFLLLRRLGGATWPSAGVAALFAWHPLHVESVAWIAERKDVLSAFFFLLSLWAYTRYAFARDTGDRSSPAGADPVHRVAAQSSNQGPGGTSLYRWYLVGLVLFALALMSKPMAVTLPCVLLLLDYWPLGRGGPWRRLLLEKLPFFALAAGACVLTLAAQEPALVSTRGLPLWQRALHAVAAYGHYTWVTFVPRHLAIFYPYDRFLPAAQLVASAFLLAGVTALVLWQARRRPYLLMGWCWFLGMLVPVIGLVQVGEQAWADRYTYLPSVGLFIAVVWAAAELAGKRAWVRVLAPVVAVCLLAASWAQLGYWKTTRTLFERAVQVTRNNHMATTLLGSLLARDGKLDEAVKYYRDALRMQPRSPEAEFFLAHALEQQGKLDEAIALYEDCLWYRPIQEQAHIFLGAALAKQKRSAAALAHYEAALKVNPDSAVAHNNLARLLHTEGRLDEAIAHYQAALNLDPQMAEAHNNLGILLLQQGRAKEGAEQLREALRLKPGDPEAQYNLAQALNQQQQWSEAAELFAKTVPPSATDPNAHCQFALALARLGRTREALSRYASALLINQDFVEALDGLSWLLATAPEPQFRNGAEATRMAERACELTSRKDPARLKTLAAAYAETGRYAEAVATAQAAADLALKRGRGELAAECNRMKESFAAGKPWRVP